MSLPYVPPQRKTKVVFVQLGSPEAPTPRALRKYLRDFLGDPRVIDIDPQIWKPILYGFVLPFRPQKSAALYARIWDGENFPLITNTEGFAAGVRDALKSLDPKGYVEVNHAFLLSPPFVRDVFDSWEGDVARNEGATRLVVIPMFPQYSESTTASGIDTLAKELGTRVKIPTFEVITNFHRSRAFIDNSVRKIDEKLQRLKEAGNGAQHLILSFHGIQKRRIINKGDDYYRHCFETTKLITDRLQHIAPKDTVMTFQSRFGSEEWITPYTNDVVKSLIESGKTELVVCSPSFIADCLETTDELGHELVQDAKEWGGNVHTVDCLNMDPQWCKDFAHYTFTQAEGSAQDKEDLEYKLSADDYADMPTLRMSEGSSDEGKRFDFRMPQLPTSKESASTGGPQNWGTFDWGTLRLGDLMPKPPDATPHPEDGPSGDVSPQPSGEFKAGAVKPTAAAAPGDGAARGTAAQALPEQEVHSVG